jgi:hypothetical protein
LEKMKKGKCLVLRASGKIQNQNEMRKMGKKSGRCEKGFCMRGQVSLEVVLGFVVLMLLFMVILAHNYSVQESTRVLEEKFGEQKECLKLAYLISEVYGNGKGTVVSFELKKDATVFAEQKIVQVGQQQCGFLAKTQDQSIDAGTVALRNNGEVEIEAG